MDSGDMEVSTKKPEVTVLCVLWQGEWIHPSYGINPGYHAEYVYKLKAMVERYMPCPMDFICLSNFDFEIPGGKIVRLAMNEPGWWSKIELFRPDLPIKTNRCLYLDLDSIIVDDLKDIVDWPEEFVAAPLTKYWRGQKNRAHSENGRFVTCCAAWTKGWGEDIWSQYNPAVAAHFRADEDWIYHLYGALPCFPGTWFSKVIWCDDKPPDGVKVLACVNDKPHIAAQKKKWIKELWG